MMYQLYVVLSYMYIIWQYFYMAFYLKTFFNQLDSLLAPTKGENSTQNAMRKSMWLIITSLSLVGLGIIVWLGSYTLSGLNGQLAFYLGQAFITSMCAFGNYIIDLVVLLFAELRSASKKVAASGRSVPGGTNSSDSTKV
jgi:hypothetical protein